MKTLKALIEPLWGTTKKCEIEIYKKFILVKSLGTLGMGKFKFL